MEQIGKARQGAVQTSERHTLRIARPAVGMRRSVAEWAKVLVDARTTAFVLVVELDDKSPCQRDRRGRDDFVDRALAAAGIPVVRVPAAARYDVADLRTQLESASR